MKKFFALVLLFFLSSMYSLAYIEKETLIILDQSASMLEHHQGVRKIDYARMAIRNIVQSLPDNEYVGLRTVGVHPMVMFKMITEVPNALCRATALLNEIDTNNKQNILNSLNGIMPSGASPLQYTLETAINNDFDINSRVKHIILVTDGYENCDGDPCNYIRRIMMSRSDLKIDIVAIGVPPDDKNKLSCLTSATKGNIHDINTKTDIPTMVNNVVARPINTTSSINYTNNTPQYRQPQVNYMQSTYNPNIKKRSYLLEFYE